MSARRPWTPDVVRKRIQATKLMQRLMDHAFGLIEMTPTQIKSAEILLRKTVPDLRSIEHTGEIRHRRVEEWSDEELAAYITRHRSERVAQETASPPGPAEVH